MFNYGGFFSPSGYTRPQGRRRSPWEIRTAGKWVWRILLVSVDHEILLRHPLLFLFQGEPGPRGFTGSDGDPGDKVSMTTASSKHLKTPPFHHYTKPDVVMFVFGLTADLVGVYQIKPNKMFFVYNKSGRKRRLFENPPQSRDLWQWSSIMKTEIKNKLWRKQKQKHQRGNKKQ